MPAFRWVAETSRGKTIRGEIEAVDEKIARRQLKRRNLTPVKIKPKPKDLFENLSFLQPKVKAKDLVIFTRQFSTLLDSGLPLAQSLALLTEQTSHKTLKGILKQIGNDVGGGLSLAEAFKKHPRIFNSLYVNLIAAGETGGVLDTILQRLAAYVEKAEKLRSTIRGAMVYPAVVAAVAVMVIAVILAFVIPVFEDLFAGMGAGLPAPTQFVVDLSRFTRDNAGHILTGIVLLIAVFSRYRKTRHGRTVMDALALKLPVIGLLLRKVAIARLSRTLGTMISSGIPILDALDIAARTSDNVILEEAISDVRTGVIEGRSISEPLLESGLFPGMVVQMVAVGEATGALDTMLEKIASFYDEEVDAAVAALTAALEPMMIVFLGGAVGGLVIAMYLPIFRMAAFIG
ncbi:type II secretion system F family protein [Desulfatiglans anilini]|uniref:type II secretion system F family protein n=1 Tax=Desulfatiglans anilini TaxID=90728 RepID=UPI0004097211|nr:type II secretion system F family protein [Desulfatiglans anilini]